MKTQPSLLPLLFHGRRRVCAKKTKPNSCTNLKKQYPPPPLEHVSSSSHGSSIMDANKTNTTIAIATTDSGGSCSANYTRKRKISSTTNSNINLVIKNENLELSTDLVICDETWNWAMTKNMKVIVEREAKNVKADVSLARFRSCTHDQEEILPIGVSTELNLFEDPFTIKKTLMKSDVGQLCRLLFGLELVHAHILPVLGSVLLEQVYSDKGTRMSIRDLDTMTDHHLSFKKWLKPNCYVFINGWSAEFVNRRNLKAGDEIGLFWDDYNSRFGFRVLARHLGNI